MQASSAQGKAVMLLSPAEWKYARPVCYFSIHGHATATGPTQPADPLRKKKTLRLSLWRTESPSVLNRTQQTCAEVISYIYEKVDGHQLSLTDRKYETAQSPHLRAQDDHNVTYFETEYAALVQLLHQAGAANGQVFYDLGCGTGKALLSAALSGIRFVKCVGVEVLPTLANAAQDRVNALVRNHQGGDAFRTPQGGPDRGDRDRDLR
jgi:trans-aconitate methyltransferase